MLQDLTTNSQKERRFKLIEKALEAVIEPIQVVLETKNLGFSQKKLSAFKVLKKETSFLYEHLNFLANACIEIYKLETDESFWQAYTPTLLKAEVEVDMEYRPKYEKKHIDNAIQNAFYFFFGLYAALPKTYFKIFKKELDVDTFKQLILNSNRFSKAMSIIHFDMFRSFLYSSTQTKSGVATKLHLFFPDTFNISEDLEITMSQEALSRAKKHTKRLLEENKASISKESPTIGCPAKFVKVEADKDLIDLIHAWTLKVMDSFIFS